MERSLEEEIEQMREAMMDVATRDGLTADETWRSVDNSITYQSDLMGSSTFLVRQF